MAEFNPARGTRFYDAVKGRLLGLVEKRLGGHAGTLARFLMLLPDILVLVGRIVLDKRVPRPLRVRIGIVITYMSSPLDLLPEVVLGPLGLLDDIILAAFVLDRILREVDPEILAEHWSGRPDQLETLRDLSDLVIGIFGQRLGGSLRRWFGGGKGAYAGPGGLEVVREEESEEDRVERYRAAGL